MSVYRRYDYQGKKYQRISKNQNKTKTNKKPTNKKFLKLSRNYSEVAGCKLITQINYFHILATISRI